MVLFIMLNSQDVAIKMKAFEHFSCTVYYLGTFKNLYV